MGDADLMIHFHHRDRARAALEAAGFQVQVDAPRRFGLAATAFAAELTCRKTAGTLIELHWNLTASQWLLQPSALDVALLFQDAQPLALEDMWTLQLSPCDALLHLCLHLVHHGFAHRVGYTDISRLLSHYQPFPWEAFLSRANRFRLRTACYFPLEMAASLGAPIPGAALDALRPPAWQQRIVRRIVDPRRVLRGEVHYPTERNSLLHLSVADRPLGVLRTVAWFFFPGPRHMADRYALRGPTQPIPGLSLASSGGSLARGGECSHVGAEAEMIGRLRGPAAVLARYEIWAVALCVAASVLSASRPADRSRHCAIFLARALADLWPPERAHARRLGDGTPSACRAGHCVGYGSAGHHASPGLPATPRRSAALLPRELDYGRSPFATGGHGCCASGIAPCAQRRL